MKFTNHTPYRALLNRMVVGPDTFAAALVARVTFDLAPDPIVARDQVWPLSKDSEDGPRGPMDGEGPVFYRGGVDLCVWGTARAAAGVPVSRAEVVLEANGWKRTVRVVGDRIWVKDGASLVPSTPAPFREMPLSPERAYGGHAEWDGLDVVYPPNPEGRGFYVTEEEAEGGLLPNLEDPATPVTKWDAHPQPVGLGFCLLGNGARMQNGTEFDDQGVLKTLRPVFFNSAFPEMILPSVSPGDRVRITGVLSEGPFEVALPHLPLMARLTFDDEVSEHALGIDQIGIEIDANRMFLSYRFPFRYVLIPEQYRACEIFVGPSNRAGELLR